MAPPTDAEAVSFVIPAWRSDAFLVPAVASALAQTYPNTEVVLVLDGPVALGRDDLPKGDVRIVRLPERLGPAAARNAGLRAADGALVAVLDADDLAHPDRANAQAALLSDRPDVALVGGSMLVIDAAGRAQGRRGRRGLSPDATRRVLPLRNPLVHSSVMARRSTLESLGGYDETLSRFIDYDLYLRAALAGFRIARSATVVGAVRVHGDRLSGQTVPEEVLRKVTALRADLGARLAQPRAITMAVNRAWLAANHHQSRAERLRRIGRVT
jgi:GT2 family glycosyltransferase